MIKERPGKQRNDQRSALVGHNSQRTVKRMVEKAPVINQAKAGDKQINPGTCDFNQRDSVIRIMDESISLYKAEGPGCFC